jgi:hypothetical protein
LNKPICSCIEEHHGDPYSRSGCRPECITNSDCSRNLACKNYKCQPPCLRGSCGTDALCSVQNHQPVCSCPPGTEGDPYRYCAIVPVTVRPLDSEPCSLYPCGVNTICKNTGSSATCECINGYFGSPYGYGCKPECVVNADCQLIKTCSNNKCVDPCINTCGYNSICSVKNHSPYCSCPQGMIGDPFVNCVPVSKEQNPCYPNPCRENGICQNINGIAKCSYPECVQNSDCTLIKACFNQKCADPCLNACGQNAICQVVNHKAVCSCPRGFIGSPFVQCSIERDPLPLPECTSDDECSKSQTCINQKCINPCSLESCGLRSHCYVQSKISI